MKTAKKQIFLVIPFLITGGFLFLFLTGLVYNQNRVEANFLECSDIKTIPVGEAVDGTEELLTDVLVELGNLDALADLEIESSLKIIELANQCNTTLCPDQQIEEEFEKVEEYYNGIKSSYEIIGDLVEGKSEKVDDDIKVSGDGLLTKLTKSEYISRKLDKARKEFDGCKNPPYSEEDFFDGKVDINIILDCGDVEGEYIDECMSPLNLYCCQ